MKKLMAWGLVMLLFCTAAIAEEAQENGIGTEFDFANEDYGDATIILDDPAYFMDLEEEEPPEQMVSEAETATPTDMEAPLPTASPANKPSPKRKRAPTLHAIPQELLDADPAFAALMEEANKYVGYPYVWGGSNPETSFDCSGFVSWVYTQSGVYNVGRKGATGLYNLCEEVSSEDVRPGDLVFFQGTMGPDVEGITHVGIYVGDHWMLHCGDPIGYADLTEERWVKWFHSYGRLITKGDEKK